MMGNRKYSYMHYVFGDIALVLQLPALPCANAERLNRGARLQLTHAHKPVCDTSIFFV